MYAVIELQKSSDTQLATLVTTHATLNEAYSKYHSILAAAAISSVPVHGAVILSDMGDLLATQHFEHESEE